MTTRGRGRPREITADELRSVALELFTAQGYDRTSLTQIAREAGISRTTLFALFPTKRDIVWADHDLRVHRLHEVLHAAPSGSIVDTVERALLTIAHYTVDEHDVLARRYRLVSSSPELRAYSALAVAEMADEIVRWVRAHRNAEQPEVIERVVQALIAVSANVIDAWAADPAPTQDLEPYLRQQLAPFTAALGPLIEEPA